HACDERFMLEQLLENKFVVAQCTGATADDYLDVGTALALLGRYFESIEVFRRVLAINPGHVAGHLNLAYSLLAIENFSEAWEHLEWRLKRLVPDMLPPWPMLNKDTLGTHSSGTTVLVHCEQGYGDTIQFSRFLQLLGEAGYRIVVSCQPQMCALVASAAGVSSVIPHGEPLPVCDLQVLLLSLPWLLSVNPGSLLARTPYLMPEQEKVTAWKKRLEEKNTST
ncbi:MAG: tetratricopeptide repeat protein, partial [Desulfuromonadaceae bacterium]|nr:tetratricopeptide repeat protein [Desulfuromonadaceae bacterium]